MSGFIVLSGVVGRFIDQYQCGVIAREAASNRVGIAKATRSHLFEQEFVIERYYAGKSEEFKQYCALAIQHVGTLPMPYPVLPQHEQIDFQRVLAILLNYVQLTQSLAAHPHGACASLFANFDLSCYHGAAGQCSAPYQDINVLNQIMGMGTFIGGIGPKIVIWLIHTHEIICKCYTRKMHAKIVEVCAMSCYTPFMPSIMVGWSM